MQLDQGPPSLIHRGAPNLIPDDKEKLKGILAKQKQKEPLTPEEKLDLRDLKDILRPDIPYDEHHPNHEHLGPDDKDKLADLNNKVQSDQPLSKQDQKELARVKDFMDDPEPVDENHSGWANLSPDE